MREVVLAEEQLVEGHADRPDVRLAVVALVVKHLGSHVQRRTQDRLHLLVLRTQQLRKAEVCDLDGAVVLEYIGQFEVPVHDFAFD